MEKIICSCHQFYWCNFNNLMINLILYLVDLSKGVEKPRVLDKQKYPIVIAN